MQSSAYVDQIPAGARPPALPTIPRPTPLTAEAAKKLAASPSDLPGLYVQFASVTSQSEAIAAALALNGRVKTGLPPVIRGVKVVVNNTPRIRMVAGPFADPLLAQAFCGEVLPKTEPCIVSRYSHF